MKDESLDIYLFRIGVPLRVGINVSHVIGLFKTEICCFFPQNLPLDHPRTDFKKLSNDQSAELTIYWKQNDPPQTIKQVLKPFDLVSVDIMSEFDLNMKKLKLTVRFSKRILRSTNINCCVYVFLL